ncbi:MAG: hypothetical protein PWP25_1823 [Sphaerochaeta sp.]|nr:hypothetical protein [Sphaerochaeta sp.]
MIINGIQSDNVGYTVYKEAKLGCLSASSAPNCLLSSLVSKPSRSVLSAPDDIGFCPQGVRLCRTLECFLFTDVREVDVPGQKLLPVLFGGTAGNPVQDGPKVIHLVDLIKLRILGKRIHHTGNLCPAIGIGKKPVGRTH